MARATAQRRTRRVRFLALTAMAACLGLVGWAVGGLLTDRPPVTAEFGPSSVTVQAPTVGPAPEPRSSREATGPSGDGPPSQPAPAATAGPIPPPARFPAGLREVTTTAAPVRLSVPSLDLVVPLEAVGVTGDGLMEIPEDVSRAGWYRHGAAPGADEGSAVLAGHVDSRSGPGAFFALTTVQEGAEVVVDLDDGSSVTYRVVGGEVVGKRDLAVDELFRRDGAPVLRLVTCAGEWSPQAGSYTDNLVISAVPTR